MSELSFMMKFDDSDDVTEYVVKIRDRSITDNKKVLECARKLARPFNCYEDTMDGLKFLYIYNKESGKYNVFVYPVRKLEVGQGKITVVDYKDQYYVQVFNLLMSRYDVSHWFDSLSDRYYVLHKILGYLLDSTITKVCLDSHCSVIGFIAVETSEPDTIFVPDLKAVEDKEKVIRYCTDITLMQQIAFSFTEKYDSYCRAICTLYNKDIPVLIEEMQKELHGRGYQSIGYWSDAKFDSDKYESCGFVRDSVFYSRILSGVTIDGINNGVRYICEI